MSDPIYITLTKKVISVTTMGRGLRGYGVEMRLSEAGAIQWRQQYYSAEWQDIITKEEIENNTAAHVHFKWHAEGLETLLNAPDAYIGIYSDNTAEDSTVYADYQWYKYKGEKGDRGDPAYETKIQYSANKTTWTATVPAGCIWLRASTDNGATWGDAVELASIAALALKAPLNSPAFTGIPIAPTCAVGTNTTQLANTAFTRSEIDYRIILSGGDPA